jgi:hypothetical protein
VARFDLGLSDEEFIAQTPFSLQLLMKRAEMADFKMFRGHAQVAAILANIHRDTKKHPEGFTELDFIPPHVIPVALRKKKQTFKDLSPIEKRKALAGMFGHSLDKDGKIIPKKKREPKKVKRGSKVAK